MEGPGEAVDVDLCGADNGLDGIGRGTMHLDVWELSECGRWGELGASLAKPGRSRTERPME